MIPNTTSSNPNNDSEESKRGDSSPSRNAIPIQEQTYALPDMFMANHIGKLTPDGQSNRRNQQQSFRSRPPTSAGFGNVRSSKQKKSMSMSPTKTRGASRAIPGAHVQPERKRANVLLGPLEQQQDRMTIAGIQLGSDLDISIGKGNKASNDLFRSSTSAKCHPFNTRQEEEVVLEALRTRYPDNVWNALSSQIQQCRSLRRLIEFAATITAEGKGAEQVKALLVSRLREILGTQHVILYGVANKDSPPKIQSYMSLGQSTGVYLASNRNMAVKLPERKLLEYCVRSALEHQRDTVLNDLSYDRMMFRQEQGEQADRARSTEHTSNGIATGVKAVEQRAVENVAVILIRTASGRITGALQAVNKLQEPSASGGTGFVGAGKQLGSDLPLSPPGQQQTYGSNSKVVVTEFTPTHGQVLEAMGCVAGLALSNARAFARLDRSAAQSKWMLDMLQIFSSELDVDVAVDRIIECSYAMLNCDRCSLYLMDESEQELVCRVSQDVKGIRIPLDAGIAGSVYQSGVIENVPNVSQDDRFDPSVDVKSGYMTTSILCGPIRNLRGKVVGVMQAINKRPVNAARGGGHGGTTDKAWPEAPLYRDHMGYNADEDEGAAGATGPGGTEGANVSRTQRSQQQLNSKPLLDQMKPFGKEDEMLLHAISTQAGIALNNANLYRKESDARRKSEILVESSRIISSELRLKPLIKRMSTEARRLINADRCAVFMLDNRTHELWSVVAEGVSTTIRFPANLGVAGQVVKTGKSMRIGHAYSNEFFSKETDMQTGYFTETILAVPIFKADGVGLIGVVQMINKQPSGNKFSDADCDFLEAFASMASIAISNAQQYEKLQEFGNYVGTVLQSLSNYVFTINNKGQLVICNRHISEILNEDENVLRMRSYEEWIGGDNGNGQLAADISRVLLTGEPVLVTDYKFKIKLGGDVVGEVDSDGSAGSGERPNGEIRVPSGEPNWNIGTDNDNNNSNNSNNRTQVPTNSPSNHPFHAQHVNEVPHKSRLVNYTVLPIFEHQDDEDGDDDDDDEDEEQRASVATNEVVNDDVEPDTSITEPPVVVQEPQESAEEKQRKFKKAARLQRSMRRLSLQDQFSLTTTGEVFTTVPTRPESPSRESESTTTESHMQGSGGDEVELDLEKSSYVECQATASFNAANQQNKETTDEVKGRAHVIGIVVILEPVDERDRMQYKLMRYKNRLSFVQSELQKLKRSMAIARTTPIQEIRRAIDQLSNMASKADPSTMSRLKLPAHETFQNGIDLNSKSADGNDMAALLGKVRKLLASPDLFKPAFMDGGNNNNNNNNTNNNNGGASHVGHSITEHASDMPGEIDTLLASSRRSSSSIALGLCGDMSGRREQDENLKFLRMAFGFNTDDQDMEREAGSVTLSTQRDNAQSLDTMIRDIDSDETYALRSWELDLLRFHNNELIPLVLDQFADLQLVEHFTLSLEKLNRWLAAVSKRYRDNPFHNFHHAVNVAHVSYLFLVEPGIMSNRLHMLDVISLMIAALSHDLDHPGHSNQFLVNLGSPLAILYNDRSVLENHHAALSYQLLNRKECAILGHLPAKDQRYIRKMVVSSILHTDMALHYELMSKFDAWINQDFACGELDAACRDDPDVRVLVVNTLLHCADLSNPVRVFDVSKQWAMLLNEEFTKQVEREEKLGLPVSEMMKNGHDMAVLAQREINFLDFVVLPCWANFVAFLPSAKAQVQQAYSNREHWLEAKNTSLADPPPAEE